MRGLVAAAVLLAIAAGVYVWVNRVEADAEAHARAFCERFPVGSALADVAAAAKDAGDARHRMIRANNVSVAYIGVPPFSRHICAFEGRDGKVSKVWYVYVD